jgi:Tfp pilus assembly protein PilF
VLATLGYGPGQRRTSRSAAVLAIVLLIGLAGAAWLGWHNYMGDSAGPASALRAPVPALPRYNPPQRPVAPETALSEPAPTRPSNSQKRDEPRGAVPRRSLSGVPPAPAKNGPQPSRIDSPAPASALTSNHDLELAIQAQRAGDFDGALQRYRTLLEKNELNVQARNNLGILYQEKGLLQDSLRELQRAATIEPRNAGTHNNYGVTLLLLGRTDHAVAEFQTALKLDPGNLDARVNLALAERSSGHLDAAKEALLEVLSRAPANAPAHYNLAQLYDQTNEPARAVEHYRLFLDHASAEQAGRADPVRARIAALSKMPE